MKKKILFAVIVTLCLMMTACSCKHEWQSATCTAPETCKLCGETQGEVPGHVWVPATCSAPKTCQNCGETQGEALGHDLAEATCEDPRICKVCGHAMGEPLGHVWTEATCTEAKTCSVCQKQDGKPTDHQPGEEKATGYDMVQETFDVQQSCTQCGEVVDETTYKLKTMILDGYFMMNPEEYVERVNKLIEKSGFGATAELYVDTEENNAISCDIIDNSTGNLVAYAYFYDGEYLLKEKDRKAHMSFNEIYILIRSDTQDNRFKGGQGSAIALMALSVEDDLEKVYEAITELVQNYEASYGNINYEFGTRESERYAAYMYAWINE